MQEGPDGNTDISPTYWFYHPLVGHANASRIYNSWRHLIGHGETGMINVGADRTGRYGGVLCVVCAVCMCVCVYVCMCVCVYVCMCVCVYVCMCVCVLCMCWDGVL